MGKFEEFEKSLNKYNQFTPEEVKWYWRKFELEKEVQTIDFNQVVDELIRMKNELKQDEITKEDLLNKFHTEAIKGFWVDLKLIIEFGPLTEGRN